MQALLNAQAARHQASARYSFALTNAGSGMVGVNQRHLRARLAFAKKGLARASNAEFDLRFDAEPAAALAYQEVEYRLACARFDAAPNSLLAFDAYNHRARALTALNKAKAAMLTEGQAVFQARDYANQSAYAAQLGPAYC